MIINKSNFLLESNNLIREKKERSNFKTGIGDQTNGDNFKQLFHSNIYELQKARFLEGIPDFSIAQEMGIQYSLAQVDSLNGNLLSYFWRTQQGKIYEDILTSDTALKNGSITFNEMCRRMCYNGLYDIINMNSFTQFLKLQEDKGFGFLDAPVSGGSVIAAARVKGFQGSDLSDFSTIAACAKHFAAYGFPEAGRDYNTCFNGNLFFG